MKARGHARLWLPAGALLLAGLAPPAEAAPRRELGDEPQELLEPVEPTEAALPDIAALERGERPRASASFGPAVPASAPASASGVKRLSPSGGLEPRPSVYGLDAMSFGGEGMRGSAPPPEQHVVKSGDTLWDVSTSYLGDPWRWPKLWALNPHVTNPHWIFPGDVLQTYDGRGPAPAAKPTSGASVITSNRKGALDSQAVSLRQYGFIDAGALPTSAKIVGSREEKIMLGAGDQVYLGFAADRPLKAGDRYTVFAPDEQRPIVSPETGKTVGYLVRVFGDIVIDQISAKNMGRGTLVDVLEPIERGYRVSPAVRQFKRLEPTSSAVSLEARVVAAFSPAQMLAADTFVVLSRGERDGLKVGNRAFVVRRGDGYRPVRDGWDSYDARFPKELVGELWVVDVREGAAVAWIARTTKEIRVGEIVELRKGY